MSEGRNSLCHSTCYNQFLDRIYYGRNVYLFSSRRVTDCCSMRSAGAGAVSLCCMLRYDT